MPIFEYQCRECACQFEYLVLRSTSPATCPSCHAENLERMISAVAVRSEHTQKRALRGAKLRTAKQRFEREWEAHRIAHDHDDH